VATDWANNTGQGVKNPEDFEAALLKHCPLYHELEPIMGKRPNSKPLSTNEQSDKDGYGIEVEEHSFSDTNPPDGNPTTVEQSLKTPSRLVDGVKGTTPSTLSSGSSKGSGKSSNCLTATAMAPPKKKGKHEIDDLVSALLGREDGSKEDFHTLQVREVTAKEQEAKARMLEAEAVSVKANQEQDLLSIEETVKLLRERKKLIDDGICADETIDNYLPLPQKKKKKK
jgi:hypothetical protein